MPTNRPDISLKTSLNQNFQKQDAKREVGSRRLKRKFSSSTIMTRIERNSISHIYIKRSWLSRKIQRKAKARRIRSPVEQIYRIMKEKRKEE
jgi:hypothetical protein